MRFVLPNSIPCESTTWHRLRSLVGQDALRLISEEAFHQVVLAYSEPWRQYHTLDHITSLLQALRSLRDLNLSADEMTALRLAILYHDVVYKIGRSSPGFNEISSALQAQNDISFRRGSQDYEIIRIVIESIEATIDHRLTLVHQHRQKVAALMIDLDLAGLGDTPGKFDRASELVWLEHQPVYTRDEFDAGRSKWAAGFLARDKIFQTEYFQHLEARARANLERLV
ncbi:MAG: hypothetical protein KC877_04995 [Candidatus Kaiserbacteria bacterium]|nr:hypothetical protein [Candidatus Kaiserbacteria bacterium]MCB9816076.1 hypothetical protein [Candidatus Nomurabacteria bacterium]